MISNLLQGLNIFDLSRFIIVFGFALAIIEYTNRLVDFKSPRAESRDKLVIGGIISIVAGMFVAWIGSTASLQNAALSIKGTGVDIMALGSSCVVQGRFSNKKHRPHLRRGAYGAIIAGTVIAIVAIFAEIFRWF